MDPQLERIIEKIVKFINPVKIILFGSRARGDARPDSDYDLLVIYEGAMKPHEVTVGIHRALGISRLAVDLFAMTPEQFEYQARMPTLLANVAKKAGRIVYER